MTRGSKAGSTRPISVPQRRRGRASGTLATLATLALLATAVVAAPAAADETEGPQVRAADGTTRAIDAIDPGARADGMLALYTPEFGASTGTNEFGAEAVLEPTTNGEGAYEVTDVCTVWESLDGACDNPGDNPIPPDGYVLSASPGGDDPREFIHNHLEVGDTVQVELPMFREVTTTLDATDPTPESHPDGVDDATGECFPGCRGGEQLIRYTPEFGDRTGTNQFGYEVVVVDDRVVARGGNDNEIPEDGEVLSGHGSRGEWLSTNASLGALIEVDDDQLTVTVDASAYVLAAEKGLDRAETARSSANDACLVIDDDGAGEQLATAHAALDDAHDAVEAGDETAAVGHAETAAAAADRAWQATRTSRTVETRGIWVRPEEESPEAIADTVAELADAGFTTVYLETFYQGYTIFPSETANDRGIDEQRPQFAHFDPLEVWVEEAAAHGLELHPWVHTFFVGSEEAGGPGPILEAYPEWAAVERGAIGAEEPQPSTAEAGYYFVDPSIPNARAYLHDVFDEIVTNYDVDGLHLDYIRYPISLPVDVSFSYSDHARAAFEEEAGVDPAELEPEDEAWEDWNQWRQDQVTSFVSERHDQFTEHDPSQVLSAAVFPDRFDSEENKLQHWADWSQDGVIDTLAGMSFGGSPSQSAADTTTLLDATSDGTLVVTGTYAPFSSLPTDTMLEQVDAVREAGAHGVALFAYNQLSDAQADALRRGAFRDPAESADRDLLASARHGLTDLRERVEGPHGECLDRGTQRPLVSRIDHVVRSIDRAGDGRGGADNALKQGEHHLRELSEGLVGRVEEPLLHEQMTEELDRAADLLAAIRAR